MIFLYVMYVCTMLTSSSIGSSDPDPLHGIYRIQAVGSGIPLHENGIGSQYITTRFPEADDDHNLFDFVKQQDGSYRIKVLYKLPVLIFNNLTVKGVSMNNYVPMSTKLKVIAVFLLLMCLYCFVYCSFLAHIRANQLYSWTDKWRDQFQNLQWDLISSALNHTWKSFWIL